MNRALSAQLSSRLEALAGAPSPWPGLTVRRMISASAGLDVADSVSLGVFVNADDPGGHVLTHALYTVAGGRRLSNRPLTGEASTHPQLGLFVKLEPRLVRWVWANMHGPNAIETTDGDADAYAVSAVDDELMTVVLRLISSLEDHSDRLILTPLHLQELIYRILQREHGTRLARSAMREEMSDPVAAALNHISAHLGEPLTVESVAAYVCLSPSAFSRLFREATGSSPYQYIKESRLVRGRQILAEGRFGVGYVARTVGYSSVSHFIKEFRTRFGATPGDFAAEFVRGRTNALRIGSLAESMSHQHFDRAIESAVVTSGPKAVDINTANHR